MVGCEHRLHTLARESIYPCAPFSLYMSKSPTDKAVVITEADTVVSPSDIECLQLMGIEMKAQSLQSQNNKGHWGRTLDADFQQLLNILKISQ